MFGSSLWWTNAFFLQKGLFSKRSESLHGGSFHPKTKTSTPPVLAWWLTVGTHLTFELQVSWPWIACLTLLATEPKLGIRGRRNWSWLEVDPQFITRVWKRLIEPKRFGEHRSKLLGQYSDRQTKCSANNFLEVCEREMKRWRKRKCDAQWTRNEVTGASE
jgi:hypothetical protein